MQKENKMNLRNKILTGVGIAGMLTGTYNCFDYGCRERSPEVKQIQQIESQLSREINLKESCPEIFEERQNLQKTYEHLLSLPDVDTQLEKERKLSQRALDSYALMVCAVLVFGAVAIYVAAEEKL